MTTLPLSLFGLGNPSIGPLHPERTNLDDASWIDCFRGAVDGADTLFSELERSLDWHRKRRLMFGNWYDEPRLSASDVAPGAVLPVVIDDIRSALTRHYERSFDGLFCNFYRTGSDSVAWHADRIGRTDLDPLVAIISLGGPRSFAIRPMGRGRSHRVLLHSGDILVMGGATQHHWQHAIPKCQHAAPRMSVTMRAGGPPLRARLTQFAEDGTRDNPASTRASSTRRFADQASTSAPTNAATEIS